MKTFMQSAFAVAVALFLVALCKPKPKVTLSGMHLCCGGCTNGVKKAVKDLEGVTVVVDGDNGETIITATSDEAAQVLDAIAAAGFHGESDNDKLVMKDDSGVKAGELTRLELTGIHNCCGSCDRAMRAALKDIAGIEGIASKAKTDKLVVEGKFDGLAVVKALYKEGFHGRTPAAE